MRHQPFMLVQTVTDTKQHLPQASEDHHNKRRRSSPSKLQIVLWGVVIGYIAQGFSLASVIFFDRTETSTASSFFGSSNNPVDKVAILGATTADQTTTRTSSARTTKIAQANDLEAVAATSKAKKATITSTASEPFLVSAAFNFSAILSGILWLGLVILTFVTQQAVDKVYDFIWFLDLHTSPIYTKRNVLVISGHRIMMGLGCGRYLATATFNLIVHVLVLRRRAPEARMASSSIWATIPQPPFSYTRLVLSAAVNVAICQSCICCYTMAVIKQRHMVEEDEEEGLGAQPAVKGAAIFNLRSLRFVLDRHAVIKKKSLR